MVVLQYGGGEGDYQPGIASTTYFMAGAYPTYEKPPTGEWFGGIALQTLAEKLAEAIAPVSLGAAAGAGAGIGALDVVIPPEAPPEGTTNRFLKYVGLAIVAAAASPVIYRAYKGSSKGKRAARDDRMASDLDNASQRATTIISSLAPVLALPIAYIGVDELENRGVISGHLGDDVQTLMAAMATGSLLTGVMNLAGTVVKAVV